MTHSTQEAAELLNHWASGDRAAPAYPQAVHETAGPASYAQTTGLIHEAYLRLFEGSGRQSENRTHFLGAAPTPRLVVERVRGGQSAACGGVDRSG